MPLLVLIAAALVLAACLVLVLHPDYHAGLFGNIGLGLVAAAGVARAAGILEYGAEVHVTPVGVILWTGLAMFLSRHCWKFLQRWLAGGPSWYARGRAAAAAPAANDAPEKSLASP